MSSFSFGQFPAGSDSGGSPTTDDFRWGNMSSLGRGGTKYPSPFFDGGHMHLPKSLKELFHWCRYYFLTNPLINAVCYKMASYPITELQFDGDPQVVKKYDHLRDKVLDWRQFLVEVGLDYQAYGNAFVSIHFPTIKFLYCKKCDKGAPARELRGKYRWRDMKFILTCPKCGNHEEAKQVDVLQRNPQGIKLIRWNPERIELDYTEETGETDYYYRMAPQTLSRIGLGKPQVVENMPSIFIDAARQKLGLKFFKGQIYHLKRPTISGRDEGWGMPRILPVLKDAFYLQILKKGQEMIAREHIVPLRILFPQPGSGSSDPYTSVPLASWKGKIEEEITRWRKDPNYIPVLPLPVGHQIIGGQGRAMVLHQEHRVWAEHIIAGMHTPQEFIFGGMSYSGTNVSMRNLENEFLNYREDMRGLTDWVYDSIGWFMGWPRVGKKYRPFKMADDLQRVMLYFQLNQAGKLSDHTLLSELGVNHGREVELKRRESSHQLEDQRRMQVAGAAAQAEAQMVGQRYMQAGQTDMIGGTPMPDPQQGMPGMAGGPPMAGAGQAYAGNAGAPPVDGIPPEAQSQLNMASGAGGGPNILYLAKRKALEIEKLMQSNPESAQQHIAKLKVEVPQFLGLVLQIMRGKQQTRDPLDAQQMPLPDKKPPRRTAEKALV